MKVHENSLPRNEELFAPLHMGVVHAHPVHGESHIQHRARLIEMTVSERDKENANWQKRDINNLQSNLLKQRQAPFSKLTGANS